METVTLTINGLAISARAGLTVLDVARRHDIYIPTLCHHEALRPIGACRLCQVEDEKRGAVVPACVTTISQGMVIATDSPRVIKNRKNIIRLLMAAHPESCLVCEKGNTCELRNLAARMGLGEHGLDPMPYHPMVMDLNPFLSRDLSKCIMCAKCVRVDQEVVAEGVIDYNFRGFDAHPATLFSRPLEDSKCTFCGSCLTVCPTGAIFEKDKYRLDHAGARSRSVCSFCACGCSINLEHDHNSVLGVSPTSKTNTANGISLCVKGHFGHDYLNSPDRLRTPLVKTEEGFQPVSWDEALDIVADKLGSIQETHGSEALGFMGGARATNEENYLFQKLARGVFGSNNIDHAARAQWSAVNRVLREATGFAAGSSSFKDIESSDVILVIGADPARTAPVLGYHIKRAIRFHGKKLIVIDPVKTKLAAMADVWLRPNPAADFHILRGLIRVILEEGLMDLEFVATKTRDFEGLRARFDGVFVAECAERGNVPEKDLREAARLFASGPAGFVLFGHGLVQQAGAADLARLLTGLVLLTGNLGKNRAGLVPVLKESNAQGALDMGVAPDLLPGQRPIEDKAALDSVRSVWETEIPGSGGLDSWRMIAAAGQGSLKGLFVLGENPATVFPDGKFVAEALGGPLFLVVQDMFMTETAELADVILPSTGWAEKDGTVTNMERRVQRLHKAVLSPGDFPLDWEILAQLAARRSRKWNYTSTEDILKEIEKAAPLYAGLTKTDLDGPAMFWPQPGLEEVVDTLPHGIGHLDGKALFLPPDGRDGLGVAPGPDYPFVLIQGHILEHLGTGARSSHSPRLQKVAPGVYLGLSPDDFHELGLREGDRVKVVSAAGGIEAPARIESGLPKGALFLPASFAGARPNTLFQWNQSVPGEGKNIKHCLVRLEKI
ncbi:MAG: molybdopterin-dependent oxidoreductase [Thermodesulfobacteriota bacterium]|nr:molybdopterin-dependent oxidoreductase [Thermodesulfobacteriota bacterium]